MRGFYVRGFFEGVGWGRLSKASHVEKFLQIFTIITITITITSYFLKKLIFLLLLLTVYLFSPGLPVCLSVDPLSVRLFEMSV